MSIYVPTVWLEADMDRLESQFQVSARITDRPSQGQNSGSRHANRSVARGSSQAASRVNAATALIEPSPGLTSARFIANQRADKDMSFSSWEWVQAYPNHFIGKANNPRARPFFNRITQDKTWSLFHLHDPEKSGQMHLLVPSHEFEEFLDYVNLRLGTAFTVPARGRDKYFMKFGEGGTPRPRYLKETRLGKTLDIQRWPSRVSADVEAFRLAKPADQASMRNKLMIMTSTHVSSETEKKREKEEKQAKRKEERRTMLDQVQQYLHLRGNFKLDVVFVCMDVEALEVPPRSVTEVGISILDVWRIWFDDAGFCGHAWFEFIESYHMRIREYADYRNHRFVQGCPDKFDFGDSTFPCMADVAGEIEKLLKHYTSQGRKLVFVGHDVANDIQLLKQVGFDVLNMEGLQGQCDTKDMHQAWKGLDSGRSLESILQELHIDYENLHNAGNDAAHTLQALIGIAVQDLRDQGRA